MEQHSVARLIGAPPGYIGHEEGGQLTEPVRRRPHTVVLFDEVEKAHPNIFHILLQVLDDGRLTDSQGRTVDFSNTVIILTSNLGSEFLLTMPNSPTLALSTREKVMNVVRKHFRPEFLNRLDDIVMFKKLDFRELHSIADLMLEDINKRLADKNITVSMTGEAKDYTLEHGYDPEYGARPLRRWLERHLVTELSRLMIGGMVPDNSDIIVSVDSKNNKFNFQVKRRAS
jgi:ATP-dependent Clp protease ATP-binding subunit ClpB